MPQLVCDMAGSEHVYVAVTGPLVDAEHEDRVGFAASR